MHIKLDRHAEVTKPQALTSLCAGLLMLLGIAACTGSATGEETVTSIELNRHDPNQVEVGVVTFLAGFER